MLETPIPELAPATAHARRSSLRVLDVREHHEFDGPLGRVPGSICIPRSALAEAELDPRAAWLLVCRSGRRSLVACETLRARGVADVSNLAGGMIAWNEAGLPIERTPLRDPETVLRSLAAWLAQIGAEPPATARARVEAWLVERGERFEGVSKEGVACVLERVESTLRAGRTPEDLELTLAAYRRDLAGG